jgi:hypothetical protein
MNRFGVFTILMIAFLLMGCSGSKSESSNDALSETCDAQNAHQAYLDGINAENPGDYATAIKMYTAAAEGYGSCAQTQHGDDALQAQYGEAMSLMSESWVLKKSHDSRSIDVAQTASALFDEVATSSGSRIPNRFNGAPTSTLRESAHLFSESIKVELRADAATQNAQQFLRSAPSTANGMSTFNNEDDAQAHCPDDTVVWVNLKSGVYHMKGERWYGATESGAYVCQQEADAAGDRATENGQ